MICSRVGPPLQRPRGSVCLYTFLQRLCSLHVHTIIITTITMVRGRVKVAVVSIATVIAELDVVWRGKWLHAERATSRTEHSSPEKTKKII